MPLRSTVPVDSGVSCVWLLCVPGPPTHSYWSSRPPPGRYSICVVPFRIDGSTTARVTVVADGVVILSVSRSFSVSVGVNSGNCMRGGSFFVGEILLSEIGLMRAIGWGDPHYRLLDGR